MIVTLTKSTASVRTTIRKRLFTILIFSLFCLSWNSMQAKGPDGSHWPNKIPTPHPADKENNIVIEIPASWWHLNNRLENLTAEQVDQGVLILIEPGEMQGNGTSSKAVPVLKKLGNQSWSKRVTIAPRDGFGTVKMRAIRILLVHNICLSGFVIETSVKIEGCNGFAMAQCHYDGIFQFIGFDWIPLIKNVELYELVNTTSETFNGDLMQIGTQGSNMEDLTIAGCYLVPHYFQNGLEPSPHTDAIQFYGNDGGQQTNFTIRDSVLFASNNAAIQTGGIDGLLIEDSIVIGDTLSREYYPVTEGGSYSGKSMAINGSGQNIVARNSIFYGSSVIDDRFTPYPWKLTENCTVNFDWNDKLKAPAETGTWNIVWDDQYFKDRIPSEPTRADLARIWTTTANTPPGAPSNLVTN